MKNALNKPATTAIFDMRLNGFCPYTVPVHSVSSSPGSSLGGHPAAWVANSRSAALTTTVNKLWTSGQVGVRLIELYLDVWSVKLRNTMRIEGSYHCSSLPLLYPLRVGHSLSLRVYFHTATFWHSNSSMNLEELTFHLGQLSPSSKSKIQCRAKNSLWL